MKPVARYKLTIAYDGTAFHGWQRQHPPDRPEPLRTVQGVLQSVVSEVLHQPVSLIGASRTDAGVHAEGQVAQFDADCPIPLERMAMAFNSRLPDDLEVRQVDLAPPAFDCINDCTSKQYRYRIWNTPRRPLTLRHAVWHCWTPLDVARMNDAARRVVGMHDFAGFAAAKHGRQSTIRTVHDCHVAPAPGSAAPGSLSPGSPELHVVISGSGFLYNMVRIVAGTLVEVGRGLFEPERVDEALAAADRRLAGPTLPPQGLVLEWIRY
ncbi:MAG: tRNA pseudouridine(38-40) synthase TruA [Phycisphaeraceae bacterium]